MSLYCYTPKTIKEALEIKQKENAIIFAGGTDLMVSHFIGSNTIIKFDRPVVHIANLKEIKKIKVDKENIIIGSATTFYDIINNENIPQILKDASSKIAGPPIRNIATIGGNICNASPSADSLTALYALNAKVVLESVEGERTVAIEDLITGVSKTCIADNEILTKIVIPIEKYKYSYYRKVGTRKANALSKLAFGGLVVKEAKDYKFRITFCTLGKTITRDRNIEDKFAVSDITEWKKNIEAIQECYNGVINPRDSVRSTANYRRTVAMNLIKYFFENM